jgi:CheY-like chemotaxis protein
VADGPAHALAPVEEGQAIDLVLTDYSMPGMSGIELTARLLRMKPELPIVLLTGYGLASSPEELRAHGIQAVLPKPVAIRALAETLASANPVYA